MKIPSPWFKCILLLLPIQSLAQDTVHLNLQEVLSLAVQQSIDLKIAQSETTEQEAAFQNANFAFRPQLFLGATLPNLNRSIEPRPLPDGSDAFVSRSTMYNGIGFDLNYQLEKTGGLLSLGSTVERLDVFKTSEFDYQRTYFINPINITYTQPLFTFNERSWQKKRLSLLYAEFKERYARIREEIIIQAITLFKNCFLAYQRVDLVRQKIVETDSLFAIKNRLFDIGKSTRAEILSLSLDQKNNRQEYQQEILLWKQMQMELADFLGLGREKIMLLQEPPLFQNTEIPLQKAMEYAIDNQFTKTAQERELTEAKTELDKAKKDKDIDLNLRLSLGLNNTGDNVQDLFHPLLDKEIFTASIRMPLTGWQKYKFRQKIAEERINQVLLRQDKERSALSRLAFKLVTDFEFFKQNLDNQLDKRQVANEILQITSRQFLAGNATYTDLSTAARAREEALLEYYNSLLEITEQYYQIRKLCMYDFIEGRKLSE